MTDVVPQDPAQPGQTEAEATVKAAQGLCSKVRPALKRALERRLERGCASIRQRTRPWTWCWLAATA